MATVVMVEGAGAAAGAKAAKAGRWAGVSGAGVGGGVVEVS